MKLDLKHHTIRLSKRYNIEAQIENIENYYNKIVDYFYEHCQICNSSAYGSAYNKIDSVTNNGNNIRDMIQYIKYFNHTREVLRGKMERISFKS